jgi:CBS domain containing-hemolysin-like protein
MPWLAILLGSLGLVLASGTRAIAAEPALSGGDLVLRGLSVVLLIAINAFFVTAEFAMVSVRRSRINQLVDEGDPAARTVQQLQREIDRLLSTTQFGITLSSLALGWIAERALARPIAVLLQQWPVLATTENALLVHVLSMCGAFLLVAYLQIVLGELCPKSLALRYAEQLSRVLGPPSLAIARVFHPFLWVLNQSTHLLLRLVGIRPSDQSWYSRVTPEELQLIIATSTESTGLEADERELLNNVFEFGEVTAEEVMVPRTSITAVSRTATVGDLLQELAESQHSRYPVMGDSLDDIRGSISFKEVAANLGAGPLDLGQAIAPWIRPVRFVPEYTPLGELLRLMQRTHQPLVMVVDEFGGTAGLVTLQDMVEEIIGTPEVPEDANDVLMEIVDDRTFLVQAQVDLDEVNELLNLDLPLTDDYQTLGGFLLYQFQKIPTLGETTTYRNLALTVTGMEGPRIDQVQVRRLEPGESPTSSGGILSQPGDLREFVESDRSATEDGASDADIDAVIAAAESEAQATLESGQERESS